MNTGKYGGEKFHRASRKIADSFRFDLIFFGYRASLDTCPVVSTKFIMWRAHPAKRHWHDGAPKTRILAEAIVEYQNRERVRIGTLIGVNEDGFFGTEMGDGRPDHPGAFDELIISIPWVQIPELLGRMTNDATGDFLGRDLATRRN